MSDQFDPPHVHDESPLSCSPQLRAGSFAQLFRNAAAKWRTLVRPNPPYGTQEESKLAERCGRWIIDAFRQGLLPEMQELCELIEWHTGPNQQLPAGRQSMRVRCPVNLFFDIRGGGMIHGKLTIMPDGRKIVVHVKDDQGRENCGGLLPRIVPGTLDLPCNERGAFTCLWLADLIEKHATDGADGDDRPTRGRPLKYPKALKLALNLKKDPNLNEQVIYNRCKKEFGNEEPIPKIETFMMVPALTGPEPDGPALVARRVTAGARGRAQPPHRPPRRVVGPAAVRRPDSARRLAGRGRRPGS